MAAEVFNPVQFSLEENQFLVDHLGDAPEVVEIDIHGKGYPQGVNPQSVVPAIERIFRLKQQEEHRGLQWVGVEAVKNACRTYLREMTKWRQDHEKRGAPKFPSLYVWDEKGRGHKGAVGADGAAVKTYFDDQGNRHEFALELIESGMSTFTPSWIRPGRKAANLKLIENQEHGTIECPVCHFMQNFDKDQRSSYNMARGRMAKHLTASTRQVDQHREVYTEEFASAEATIK